MGRNKQFLSCKVLTTEENLPTQTASTVLVYVISSFFHECFVDQKIIYLQECVGMPWQSSSRALSPMQ